MTLIAYNCSQHSGTATVGTSGSQRVLASAPVHIIRGPANVAPGKRGSWPALSPVSGAQRRALRCTTRLMKALSSKPLSASAASTPTSRRDRPGTCSASTGRRAAQRNTWRQQCCGALRPVPKLSTLVPFATSAHLAARRAVHKTHLLVQKQVRAAPEAGGTTGRHDSLN